MAAGNLKISMWTSTGLREPVLPPVHPARVASKNRQVVCRASFTQGEPPPGGQMSREAEQEGMGTRPPPLVESELEQAALQDALADKLYRDALADGEASREAEGLAELADMPDPVTGLVGDPLLEPDELLSLDVLEGEDSDSEGEEGDQMAAV